MTPKSPMETSARGVAALAVEEIAPDAAAEASPDRAERTPAMIAHGLFGAGRNWAAVARALAADRRVAVVDLRNHGASPWTAAMDYPLMGADILAAATATFGRDVALIGHSMGGKAAAAAALSGQGGVAALAMIDIAPVDYRGDARGDDHGAYIAAMLSASLTPETRRRDVDAALADVAPDPALRAFLNQNLIMTQGAAPRWRLNLAALRDALDALMGWPEALRSQQWDGPAFALRGGASLYVDTAGEAALRAAFPAVEITAIDGAGHWPHAERPTETVAALRDWLTRAEA